MKILLVYPQIPLTYWSFQYALKFVSKKAGFPPLGLLTVASMLPEHYEKRLVDMNVTKLKDRDILWADYVWISAMVVQKKSVREVINRCHALGVKMTAGGPLFTSEPEEYDDVDHLVLNEGENTVPAFVRDLENGSAAHIYTTEEWADIKNTPVPLWDLINMKHYATMNIQYSRGCPFHCDFCNITSLYGHEPRTKSTPQLLSELDSLYQAGWRGGIFLVDDNFIGNKKKLKDNILPALISWMKQRNYPFTFITEASINLADDDSLMNLMVKAGFTTVFIGIETMDEDSLVECNKIQNKNRNLIACVKKIQKFGLQVQGGFIVGFDNDNASIFDKLVTFIQESGIVTAMVGLLNAPKGTKLYQRLTAEGRLLKSISGDNTDFSMNFIPKMESRLLVKGYQRIVDTIYSPRKYYERVLTFLEQYEPAEFTAPQIGRCQILAFVRSVFRLGIIGRERRYYWKLIIWSLRKRRKVFPLAVTLSIYGFHFRKVFRRTEEILK
ncbi:B12-binding domain-containing radical SAM protein [Dehalobacter sp. 14DCB1]|uniref:B12-binding domain-containing radical SAM protein n=1 Tax=Dehalobacter sp. 14DCB1 TaxID=2070227 RepID=UPI00104B2957|nr:B12-binding domain-containing radical SAM protein [Dehalobacter sp. 14DCB1]TCX51628.1 B12-binding domain-containing radical SAM protein [Dehalobacter sp. 14DCB1]